MAAGTLAPGVLVVEDEYLIRLDLCDELRRLRLQVVEAGNADEALEALRSGLSIGLVVTDIRMPGERDGLDVAREARRLGLGVVVMSGHLLAHDAHGADYDLFVEKPFDSTDLATRVAELVAGGSAASRR